MAQSTNTLEIPHRPDVPLPVIGEGLNFAADRGAVEAQVAFDGQPENPGPEGPRRLWRVRKLGARICVSVLAAVSGGTFVSVINAESAAADPPCAEHEFLDNWVDYNNDGEKQLGEGTCKPKSSTSVANTTTTKPRVTTTTIRRTTTTAPRVTTTTAAPRRTTTTIARPAPTTSQGTSGTKSPSSPATTGSRPGGVTTPTGTIGGNRQPQPATFEEILKTAGCEGPGTGWPELAVALEQQRGDDGSKRAVTIADNCSPMFIGGVLPELQRPRTNIEELLQRPDFKITMNVAQGGTVSTYLLTLWGVLQPTTTLQAPEETTTTATTRAAIPSTTTAKTTTSAATTTTSTSSPEVTVAGETTSDDDAESGSAGTIENYHLLAGTAAFTLWTVVIGFMILRRRKQEKDPVGKDTSTAAGS
jgi:hypothetical protein